MKHVLMILFSILTTLFSFGQSDSTKIFESSKGKWLIPIPKYLSIYDNEQLKHFTSNQFDSTLRIITDKPYDVCAVHEGIVIALIETEGEYTVLTKFGNYFITYGRLTKVNLRRGEYLRSEQLIGQLVKNWTEHNFTLEITLYKGTQELDAKKWIKW